MKSSDILDENEILLKQISEEVVFPFKEKKIVKNMIDYLTRSQIKECALKEDLRPGMGLSAVQIGILKRFFVIVEEYFENDVQKFNNYIIINPKIISHSEEKIYAEESEGCLSVNRPVEGIVLRDARITIEYYDMNGNKKKLRARDELSIAIQHEIDHLNGILFFERIEKQPIKNTIKGI